MNFIAYMVHYKRTFVQWTTANTEKYPPADKENKAHSLGS